MNNKELTSQEAEIWQAAQLEIVKQLLDLLPTVQIKRLLEDWKQILEDNSAVEVDEEEKKEEEKKRELPEGKRVVRTKSSGDRVYYLDEEKKTRQWVTNPDVLKGLGFEIEDVVEVDDSTLLKYQMSSAIYKV